LLSSLTALLIIPVVLAMTLGMAALLAAVGDTMAAAACRWVAMALGIVWAASVVATVAFAALISLADDRPRQARRRFRRRPDARLDDQRPV
jgi:membrane protein implicated in regulation of membrane protease activity